MSFLKPDAYDIERINWICLILALILGIFLLVPQIEDLRNTHSETNTEMGSTVTR